MKITIEIQDTLIAEHISDLDDAESPLLNGIDPKGQIDQKAVVELVEAMVVRRVQDYFKEHRKYFEARKREKIDTTYIDAGIAISKT